MRYLDSTGKSNERHEDMLTQENKKIRSEVQQLKEELRTERERSV